MIVHEASSVEAAERAHGKTGQQMAVGIGRYEMGEENSYAGGQVEGRVGGKGAIT